MSLLLTAVTPDGIVLGADSALTSREGAETLTLAGYPKVTPVPQLNSGISVAGSAKIGRDPSSWIHNWLRQFVQEVSTAESFTGFANELVQTLNEASQNPDHSHVFHLAGWVKLQGEGGNLILAPRTYSIRRHGDGSYRWDSVIPDSMTQELLAWRNDSNLPYPIRFASDGIPPLFSNWIASVASPEFAHLMGRPVPYPHIAAVAEYVRFLIRSVAELHRISRQDAFVGEPVETLIIFPEPKSMVSTRY